MANIGLLIIATKKYFDFVQPLIDSADEFFLKDHNVTYYVFTDEAIRRHGVLTSKRQIKPVPTLHKEWPWMTLGRYDIFHKHRDVLQANDYLYYIDADMLIVDEVGDEVLGDLVATQHPGYYNTRGTPETRIMSTAYIAQHENTQYFAGGFQGGATEEFLKMSNILSQNIQLDFNNNIIAIWHDESHFNRYAANNIDKLKILSPSYCYGANKTIPFTPRIVALVKKHEEFRS